MTTKLIVAIILILFMPLAHANEIQKFISFSYDKNEFRDERELVKKFLEKEMKNDGAEELLENDVLELEKSIGLFTSDVNDDGYKEVFLYVNHKVFCGMSNCGMYIFSGKDIAINKTMKILLDVSVIQQGICILQSKTKGYNDIEFRDVRNNGSVWKFGDSEYVHESIGKPICIIK